MLRVLKTNGILAILEFSKPRTTPFKQIYNSYFKYLLPFMSRLWTKDPQAYSYLYDSVSAFPEREELQQILEKIGYKNLYYKPLTIGICCIYAAEKK
jgi:demethylmenaquinone methyltransferase/2-methoxy-6-polyprenyl-1,4-benzoquinol methylase